MIVVNDAVHRKAKAYAGRHGLTFSRLVEEGLRERLQRSAAPNKRLVPPLPIYRGKGGLHAGVDLDDMKSVYESLDAGHSIDKRR